MNTECRFLSVWVVFCFRLTGRKEAYRLGRKGGKSAALYRRFGRYVLCIYWNKNVRKWRVNVGWTGHTLALYQLLQGRSYFCSIL